MTGLNAPEAQTAEKPENTQRRKENKPAALPESKEAKKPLHEGRNGGGNGFVTGQVLFAKLNKHGIPTKQYMDYACKRYSVESFTDLTDEQIKEQDKLLDSMARRTEGVQGIADRSEAGGVHAVCSGNSGKRSTSGGSI